MKEVDGAVSIVEKKKKESKRLQSFHNRRAKQKSSTAFWGPMKEPAPRFWFPPFSHAGEQYSSCLVFCKYKKKKNRCQLVAICKPLWAETRESAYVTKRQTRTSGNTHIHTKRDRSVTLLSGKRRTKKKKKESGIVKTLNIMTADEPAFKKKKRARLYHTGYSEYDICTSPGGILREEIWNETEERETQEHTYLSIYAYICIGTPRSTIEEIKTEQKKIKKHKHTKV